MADKEIELSYCGSCVQMTNHRRGVCLKCMSKLVDKIFKEER